MKIPGQRIRDLRENLGWSTRDLASACAMREKYLIDIEDGVILKVHTMTYQKIADALGTTLSILNGDEEIPKEVNIQEDVPLVMRIMIYLSLSIGVLVLISSVVALCGLVLLQVLALLPLHIRA